MKTKSLSFLLHAIALAAGALLAAGPAQAAGGLIDVNVIDRDSGARLPMYRHHGQWWVAGRPGARYAIEVRNTTGARVLGVMAVDGVNILSGETAGWDQSGYVLSPRQTARITGWRKSDSEVAAFNFTALSNSYAARTGRPDDVGVIGVAVFREKAAPPPSSPPPSPPPQSSLPPPPSPPPPASPPEPTAVPSRPVPASPGGAPADAAESATRSSENARGRSASPSLGTGHGEREYSYSAKTGFERESSQPDEVIAIRYDSRDNLIALGVIPRPAPQPQPQPHPRPFPDSAPGYVPDPPAR
jgi:hypothetical protein